MLVGIQHPKNYKIELKINRGMYYLKIHIYIKLVNM